MAFKCPFKSLKRAACWIGKGWKFLVIICNIIEVCTFFLLRLLLGSERMPRGVLCRSIGFTFSPITALVLLLDQNRKALLALASLNRKLCFLPDSLLLPLCAVFQPVRSPGHCWFVVGAGQPTARLTLCSLLTHLPERRSASEGAPRCLLCCKVFSGTGTFQSWGILPCVGEAGWREERS